MTRLYPEIEPYQTGMLTVSDANLIYWEACGNPDGKPVVVLHGGPGSGCSTRFRRFFDPTAYRIILFDQRNCGRSKPHASDTNTDLTANTTQNLIADIEALRQHLHIEQWMVFGVSWGSTLTLAYAEQFPQRVTGIVLFGVTMTRSSEIDWLYKGVAPIYPAEWVKFRAGVPESARNGDLVEAYYHLLYDADATIREKAARDWNEWESASLSVDTDAKPGANWYDPEFQMARARIVTHYFYHKAFLEEGILLRNAGKLASIPGVLIQGRLDLGAPFVTAWELSQAWTNSELIVLPGAGHSFDDPGVIDAVITATDRFVSQE